GRNLESHAHLLWRRREASDRRHFLRRGGASRHGEHSCRRKFSNHHLHLPHTVNSQLPTSKDSQLTNSFGNWELAIGSCLSLLRRSHQVVDQPTLARAFLDREPFDLPEAVFDAYQIASTLCVHVLHRLGKAECQLALLATLAGLNQAFHLLDQRDPVEPGATVCRGGRRRR